MNLLTFFVALGIGTVAALYMSWRYSRKGIHPRFYPHFGLVAVVFVTLMGGVAFLAFVISHMVGNKIPSVSAPITPVEQWALPSTPEEKTEEP